MRIPRTAITWVAALHFSMLGPTLVGAGTQVGSAPYKHSLTGAGNSYAPVFSADGRHLAFVSHANNLVTNDELGPSLDLFVRDLVASNTVLVSVSTNGFGGANDNIGLYTLSSNAQVVAFETLANNLAPGDANRVRDIYVRDLARGVTRLITPGADGPSSNPLISEDGRRVIFESFASNLVTNDFNGTNDIFIHDLTTGLTEIADSNAIDFSQFAVSTNVSKSLVAFDSLDDAIAADDLNRAWDVFVRNTDTGEIAIVSVRHPDFAASTSTSLARLDTEGVALSADGMSLALLSLDGVMVPNETNRVRDLFLVNRSSGASFQVPRPLSQSFPFQTLGGDASAPVLSTNGRYVAYCVGSMGFGGTNRGISWLDTISSTNPVLVVGVTDGNSTPAMSGDGRLVAFHSVSPLDPRSSDGNGSSDVFIKVMPYGDLSSCGGAAPLAISLAWSRIQTGNGPSFNPVFSPDSRWILFESLSTVLLAQPLPQQTFAQLYARSIATTSTNDFDCSEFLGALSNSPARLVTYSTAASFSPAGFSAETPLPGGGSNPRLSTDSRYVFFESKSGSAYRHDLGVDYIEKITNIGGVTYTNYARATNVLVCTNCSSPIPNGDGRYVAYMSRSIAGSPTQIYWKDLLLGNEELISSSTSGAPGNGSSINPVMTSDGRFVVFTSRASDLVAADNNRAADVFVRDRWSGTMHCLSLNRFGSGTGNGPSSNPVMSADGRSVAFHSFASDLVDGDFNDTRDVFMVGIGGPDVDGDGMDDDWEMAYFNTLARDGSGDFDGDGSSDWNEFGAGTNPINNRSILSIVRFTMEQHGGQNGARTVVLVWGAVPGRRYQVESKTDLNSSWQPLGSPVEASTTSASSTFQLGGEALAERPNTFYRVTVVQ